MCAGGCDSGIIWSAHTAACREGDGCGFYVVRFLDRCGRQRGFRERSVQHIAFGAAGRLDLYVTFHALDNLHRVAAFELRGDVEIGQGFVHPHAIFVRSALDVDGAARFCGGNRGDDEKREENCGCANHFASETDDYWRGRARRGYRCEPRRGKPLGRIIQGAAVLGMPAQLRGMLLVRMRGINQE